MKTFACLSRGVTLEFFASWFLFRYPPNILWLFDTPGCRTPRNCFSHRLNFAKGRIIVRFAPKSDINSIRVISNAYPGPHLKTAIQTEGGKYPKD